MTLRSLLLRTEGSVMAEFAAFSSVFVVLVLGAVDLSRLIILNQKLDRVASGVGDLVAQSDVLTPEQMSQILDVTAHVATPFDFSRDGKVIVSSVSLVGGAARINWQASGGGTLSSTSQIGTGASAPANLPAGMSVAGNDTLLIAEVFFSFSPLFDLGLLGSKRLYHRSFFRPRVGSLKTLDGQ